jgi:hypothetical protein
MKNQVVEKIFTEQRIGNNTIANLTNLYKLFLIDTNFTLDQLCITLDFEQVE